MELAKPRKGVWSWAHLGCTSTHKRIWHLDEEADNTEYDDKWKAKKVRLKIATSAPRAARAARARETIRGLQLDPIALPTAKRSGRVGTTRPRSWPSLKHFPSFDSWEVTQETGPGVKTLRTKGWPLDPLPELDSKEVKAELCELPETDWSEVIDVDLLPDIEWAGGKGKADESRLKKKTERDSKRSRAEAPPEVDCLGRGQVLTPGVPSPKKTRHNLARLQDGGEPSANSEGGLGKRTRGGALPELPGVEDQDARLSKRRKQRAEGEVDFEEDAGHALGSRTNKEREPRTLGKPRAMFLPEIDYGQAEDARKGKKFGSLAAVRTGVNGRSRGPLPEVEGSLHGRPRIKPLPDLGSPLAIRQGEKGIPGLGKRGKKLPQLPEVNPKGEDGSEGDLLTTAVPKKLRELMSPQEADDFNKDWDRMSNVQKFDWKFNLYGTIVRTTKEALVDSPQEQVRPSGSEASVPFGELEGNLSKRTNMV